MSLTLLKVSGSTAGIQHYLLWRAPAPLSSYKMLVKTSSADKLVWK